MSKTNNLTDFLTDLASAIRTKKRTTDTINPQNFANEIINLPAGGSDKAIIERTLTKYIDTNNEISYIATSAFIAFPSLSIVSFPACITIDSAAFAACYSLNTANFSACTVISNQAFWRCVSLASISFPACTLVSDTAFQQCSALTSINFPACTTVGRDVFYYCVNLTTVSLPKCSYIGAYAFQNCTKLKSVYLMSTSVATLSNSGAFEGTNISAGGIYVPRSLWTSYKTAPNWSYYSNWIKSV